jgi:hypothetical protein
MAWFQLIKEFLVVEAPEVRRERLARLAGIIDMHVADWPAVGAALDEIRDGKLYRDECPTWAEFLKLRWDMSESYASRLIAASELHRKTVPTGKPPRTEAIARPIASLPREVREEAWQDAIDLAGDDDIAPVHVARAAARHRMPGAKKKPAKPIRYRVPGAIVTVEPGRGFTDEVAALQSALSQALSKRLAA